MAHVEQCDSGTEVERMEQKKLLATDGWNRRAEFLGHSNKCSLSP